MIKIIGTGESSIDGVYSKLEDKRNIIFEMTNGCNMACDYCFEAARDKKPIRFITHEAIRKSIDSIVKKMGEEYAITFFGGEPLLNIEGIRYAIQYANQKAQDIGSYIKYYIVTNATLINEEIIQLFNRNDVYVFFSYDGCLESQDKYRRFKNGSSTFEKTTENIELFCESRKNYLNRHNASIRMTITSEFIPRLSEMYIFLRKRFPELKVGFALVSADSSKKYSITKKDLKILREEYLKLAEIYIREIQKGNSYNRLFESIVRNIIRGYRKNYFCHCGDKYIAVGVDGELYPCEGFLGYDEFRMGNIIKGSGITCNVCWENVEENAICKKCWAKYLCGGSCYQECYMLQGSINSKNEIMCETYRIAFEIGIKIYKYLINNNLKDKFIDIIKIKVQDNAKPILNKENSKWIQESNLIFTSSVDKFLLVELDEIASEIVELCNGKYTVKEIVEHIATEYESDEEMIYDDINDVFQRMHDLGVLNYIN